MKRHLVFVKTYRRMHAGGALWVIHGVPLVVRVNRCYVMVQKGDMGLAVAFYLPRQYNRIRRAVFLRPQGRPCV